MSIHGALINIINGKSDYCCLCFKRLQGDSISMQDQVAPQGSVHTKEFYEILCFILGYELQITTTESNYVCNQCQTDAVQSYNFIKMCKDNSEQLYNTINSLLTNAENSCQGSVNCESLFMTLNTADFSSNVYYDCDRSSTCTSTLLNRLQNLIRDAEIKLELQFEDYFIPPVEESNDFKYTDRKQDRKVKRNIDTKYIRTKDLIHNNNKSQCKFCFKILKTSQHVRDHYFRTHAPKMFKCTKCPRRYGKQKYLDVHLVEAHTPGVCSKCGKVYNNQASLREHEIGHRAKIVCPSCGKSYKTPVTLREHICQVQRMPLEKIFTCDYCSKKFGRKTSLSRHIQCHHLEVKMFVCSWCNKKFDSVSGLRGHEVTHTQEKKFSCEVCGGRFVTKTSLLYHTRIHTGVKPYKCEFCDRWFLSLSRRMDHVRRIHRRPSIKCDFCDSKFNSRACVRRHQKRHFNPKSKLYCPETAGYFDYSSNNVSN